MGGFWDFGIGVLALGLGWQEEKAGFRDVSLGSAA